MQEFGLDDHISPFWFFNHLIKGVIMFAERFHILMCSEIPLTPVVFVHQSVHANSIKI